MKKVLANIALSGVVLISSFSACQAPESEKNLDEELAVEDEAPLEALEDVKFEYSLGDTIHYGYNSFIKVECTVTNTTNTEIYYLNQSCNRLEYYVIPKPESYEVRPNALCNATYPKIDILLPNEPLNFSTKLLWVDGFDSIGKLPQGIK